MPLSTTPIDSDLVAMLEVAAASSPAPFPTTTVPSHLRPTRYGFEAILPVPGSSSAQNGEPRDVWIRRVLATKLTGVTAGCPWTAKWHAISSEWIVRLTNRILRIPMDPYDPSFDSADAVSAYVSQHVHSA